MFETIVALNTSNNEKSCSCCLAVLVVLFTVDVEAAAFGDVTLTDAHVNLRK